MLSFLYQNLPNIAVGALLLAAVAAAAAKLIRDRRAGRPSCSCGCSGCSGSCHLSGRRQH